MEHNREQSTLTPRPRGPDQEKTVMKLLNPKNITRPASNYSQGVVIPANARRLIISGQIGIGRDGSLPENP